MSLRMILVSLGMFVFVVTCNKHDRDQPIPDDWFTDDPVATEGDFSLPDRSDGEVLLDGEPDADEPLDAEEEPLEDDAVSQSDEIQADGDDLLVEDLPDEDNGPAYDPRIEPALCGMAPYHWLPPATMGNIIEVDQMFGSIGDIAKTSKVALTLAKTQLKNDGEVNLQRDPQYDTLVYRILYRTQDKGQPAEATGIVALPMTSKTVPILMIQHGTMGLGDPCAPSASEGSEPNGTALVAALFASFGYIVIAPDYLGLKSMGSPSTELHSYLIGEPTAIASLDMVRAVPKFLERPEVKIFGIEVKPGNVLISGGSQGGHAAAFTTRLAPYYAPELVIKGAVWGIPPTDMYAHAVRALNNYVPASGNTALVFLSANDWYRDDPSLLSQVFLPPWDTSMRDYAFTSCDLGGPSKRQGSTRLKNCSLPSSSPRRKSNRSLRDSTRGVVTSMKTPFRGVLSPA